MAMNRKRSGNTDPAGQLFDDLPFDLPEAPAKAARVRDEKAASPPGERKGSAAPKDMPKVTPGERSGDTPKEVSRLPLAPPPPPPLPPRHDPAHDPIPDEPPRRLSISERALRASGGPAGAPYLDGLNPEQRAAVEALDGPVLVLRAPERPAF